VLQPWRKPLVVFTPKGMLRAPSVASEREQFVDGAFTPVLEHSAGEMPRRILLCTGRIVHELTQYRKEHEIQDVAIVSLEQLYPFPTTELERTLAPYHEVPELMWVQEEPRNMGALGYVRHLVQDILGGRRIRTVRRAESASPATGSAKAHRMEQDRLVEMAFSNPSSLGESRTTS
jgi:2-oxoglutarate dehydrogenase E1 component